MVAIILAAGYATRLYPITLETPKALLRINEKTMLHYILDQIDRIDDVKQTIIVSNNKFYNHFVDWIHKEYEPLKNCDGSKPNYLSIINDGTSSEQSLLGAIGDIQFTIETLKIDDEIIVIAGDNFFTFQLTDLIEFYKHVDTDCVIVKKMVDRNALKSLGVASIGPDFRVMDFEEKPQNPKSDYAVFATYIYKRDTLPLFNIYISGGNPKDAPGNFPAWLCKRKYVSAYAFDGECYDVGTPQAYNDICAMYNGKRGEELSRKQKQQKQNDLQPLKIT